MDWARRSPRVLRLTCLLAVTAACNPSEQLPAPDEIEARLRDDPMRPARVGQLVGIAVSQHAHQTSLAIAHAPDDDCGATVVPGERWIAELTLERRRGASIEAIWTETRTLDRTETAVAMRTAADFRTRIGGEGTRAMEWRVLPTGTFIATQTGTGDFWIRRDTEEKEADRLVRYANGMLQSLLDAGGGWQQTADGWTLGEAPLRCGESEGAAFLPRFGGTPATGTLRADDRRRVFSAAWVLSDGSKVVAEYQDRIVELPDETIVEPPPERVVPIARDRSLYRAQQLLTKLADDGLATVASAPPPKEQAPSESGDRKSK